MQVDQFLTQIVNEAHTSRSLSQNQAYDLFYSMLDGELSDLELGALVLALNTRIQSVDEIIGFYNAMQHFLNERNQLIELNWSLFETKPIIFSSYNGTFQQSNLLPLLILLLKQFDIPIILHGLMNSPQRIMTAEILKAFDYQAVSDLNQVEDELLTHRLAIIPVELFSPIFKRFLSLRWELGIKHCLHKVIKLLNPFKITEQDKMIHFVSTSKEHYLYNFEVASHQLNLNSLLMPSTDGEAFANPLCRPSIHWVHSHHTELLFKHENLNNRVKLDYPQHSKVSDVVEWIEKVLSGSISVPMPIVNQLTACVLASGYAQNLIEAKAIVSLKLNELKSLI